MARIVYLTLFVVSFFQSGAFAHEFCESINSTTETPANYTQLGVLTCPPLGGGNDEAVHCCYSLDGFFCCNDDEFIRSWTKFLLVLLFVSGLVVTLLFCCICCLCCPCCIWYKHRNRGTVYNTVARESHFDGQNVPQAGVYQQQNPPPYPLQQYVVAPQQSYPMMTPHSEYPPASPSYPEKATQPTQQPYSGIAADPSLPRQTPYNPNFQ